MWLLEKKDGKMEIGCNTVAFRRFPLDFALEKIREGGFEYVEVEANPPYCMHVDPWKDDPVRFAEKVKGHGFAGISAIGNHRELITSETGVEDNSHTLEWAKAAGIPAVITGDGTVPEGMSIEDALKVLKDRFGYLSEIAAKNGTLLLIEEHGTISLRPDGLPLLLEQTRNEWFGVNFDTANIRRGDYIGAGGNGFEWKIKTRTEFNEVLLLEKVADRVFHVHAKDVVERNAVTPRDGSGGSCGLHRHTQAERLFGRSVLRIRREGRTGRSAAHDTRKQELSRGSRAITAYTY